MTIRYIVCPYKLNNVIGYLLYQQGNLPDKKSIDEFYIVNGNIITFSDIYIIKSIIQNNNAENDNNIVDIDYVKKWIKNGGNSINIKKLHDVWTLFLQVLTSMDAVPEKLKKILDNNKTDVFKKFAQLEPVIDQNLYNVEELNILKECLIFGLEFFNEVILPHK